LVDTKHQLLFFAQFDTALLFKVDKVQKSCFQAFLLLTQCYSWTKPNILNRLLSQALSSETQTCFDRRDTSFTQSNLYTKAQQATKGLLP